MAFEMEMQNRSVLNLAAVEAHVPQRSRLVFCKGQTKHNHNHKFCKHAWRLLAHDLGGTPVRVFHSRYTIAIVYRQNVFHVSQGIALYPSKAALSWGVSQDYVGSMLLVLQLKLPSRSYRALGVSQLYCRRSWFKTTRRAQQIGE